MTTCAAPWHFGLGSFASGPTPTPTPNSCSFRTVGTGHNRRVKGLSGPLFDNAGGFVRHVLLETRWVRSSRFSAPRWVRSSRSCQRDGKISALTKSLGRRDDGCPDSAFHK